MSYLKELTKGVWERNPVLILGIGNCPVLAVSTSVENAFWMTLAATFVLVFSNIFVSLVRRWVLSYIRIPIFITIIASFVIIVELTLKAFQPAIYKAMGIFIPLIVVNCIILGRAEDFAYKNGVLRSTLDGIGMGLGFGFVLAALAVVREPLGANKLLGYTLIPGMEPSALMLIAPGAFFTLAFLLTGMNYLNARKKR
jgi:Na+-translocating ferredoxin:NAD+ oxidoreductase subunit E